MPDGDDFCPLGICSPGAEAPVAWTQLYLMLQKQNENMEEIFKIQALTGTQAPPIP